MSKLSIQFASDLHLEFREHKDFSKILIPSAPILVLCGDICTCGSEKEISILKLFIEAIEDKFKYIIYVPGNHEFYTHSANKRMNTVTDIENRMRNYFKTKKNIYFLNNNVAKLTIDGVLFYIIGTTLWSSIDKPNEKIVQTSMNDYTAIFVHDETMKSMARRNRVSDTNQRHHKAVAFIKRTITRAKKNSAKCIIVTHHCPYIDTGAHLQAAYYSDMAPLMGPPVILWFHGHTHINKSVNIKGTRVQSNCLGYPYERCNFDHKAIVKV